MIWNLLFAQQRQQMSIRTFHLRLVLHKMCKYELAQIISSSSLWAKIYLMFYLRWKYWPVIAKKKILKYYFGPVRVSSQIYFFFKPNQKKRSGKRIIKLNAKFSFFYAQHVTLCLCVCVDKVVWEYFLFFVFGCFIQNDRAADLLVQST